MRRNIRDRAGFEMAHDALGREWPYEKRCIGNRVRQTNAREWSNGVEAVAECIGPVHCCTPRAETTLAITRRGRRHEVRRIVNRRVVCGYEKSREDIPEPVYKMAVGR